MASHPARPGERLIYLEASAWDGYFAYVLVQGDEAVQRMTRGLTRRVQLDPRRGLGSRLNTLHEEQVASFRDSSWVQNVVGEPPRNNDDGKLLTVDGVQFELFLRFGAVERRIRYWGTGELRRLGGTPELDLMRALAPYMETRERMPDLLAEPRED